MIAMTISAQLADCFPKPTSVSVDARSQEAPPSTRLLAAVIEANLAPTSVKDDSRKYIAANSAFLELLDADLTTVQGKRDEELLMPVAASEWMRRDMVVIETGEAVSDLFEVQLEGRSPISIRGVSQPIYDEGRVIGVVTCLDPHVAHREAWQAREQRLLFQVGQLAHELRSPLAGVIGLTRLTKQDGNLTSAQRQRLEAIERCSEHLNSTLDDLVEVGLVGAAAVTLRPHPIEMVRLLADISDWVRPLIDEQSIELNATLHGAGPELTAWIDGQRLRQVLLNLLSNAARATQRGQISVRCTLLGRRESLDSDHNKHQWLRFEVTDTGHGMSTEQLASMLSEGNALELWKDSGSIRRGGLGLLISRRLVRALGGELQVRSEEGNGTTFWFEITARVSVASDGTGDQLHYEQLK